MSLFFLSIALCFVYLCFVWILSLWNLFRPLFFTCCLYILQMFLHKLHTRVSAACLQHSHHFSLTSSHVGFYGSQRREIRHVGFRLDKDTVIGFCWGRGQWDSVCKRARTREWIRWRKVSGKGGVDIKLKEIGLIRLLLLKWNPYLRI